MKKKIQSKSIKKKRMIYDRQKYKLTEMELTRMMFRGIISAEQRDLLIKTSKLRPPNTPAQQRFQAGLNGSGTIMLNSINLDGGETLANPYHFLGEITHKVTALAFKRFMRVYKIPAHPFKN